MEEIWAYLNQFPEEIRNDPLFMRERSLSEDQIDSIVQGILDVNAACLDASDLASLIFEITNSAPQAE
jgi:hypothetical protein